MPPGGELRRHGQTGCAAWSARAGSKPVWAVVELGHPFSESDWPTITPAQVRAAVWQSLIAGARGIVYFNHSLRRAPPDPAHPPRWLERRLRLRIDPVGGDGHERQIKAAGSGAQLSDGQLRLVAGAGNHRDGEVGGGREGQAKKRCKSQEGEEECKKAKARRPRRRRPRRGASRRRGRNAKKAKGKKTKGQLYVFAGSAGSPVEGRFSLPCVGDAKAAVVGENRTDSGPQRVVQRPLRRRERDPHLPNRRPVRGRPATPQHGHPARSARGR